MVYIPPVQSIELVNGIDAIRVIRLISIKRQITLGLASNLGLLAHTSTAVDLTCLSVWLNVYSEPVLCVKNV